jgi:ubiquinone/menaquinone biosynthesis C-methylase UbiE
MRDDTEKLMSESMEAHPDILPYLPELLRDMWALGSSPDKMIELIHPLKMPAQKTRVLDLGCGKGAVCIQLAKNFGFSVVGVDASEPFLSEAKIKAKEHSVDSLCQFIQADIRDYIKTAKDFDLVVMASLGGIFGGYADTVSVLRSVVKSGGYVLIDDGFLKGDEPLEKPGYTHYLPEKQALEALTSRKDRLIRQMTLTDAENSAIDREYIQLMKDRSIPLIKKHPELRRLIEEYIFNQEEECDFIEENLSGAIWLLQKA